MSREVGLAAFLFLNDMISSNLQVHVPRLRGQLARQCELHMKTPSQIWIGFYLLVEIVGSLGFSQEQPIMLGSWTDLLYRLLVESLFGTACIDCCVFPQDFFLAHPSPLWRTYECMFSILLVRLHALFEVC